MEPKESFRLDTISGLTALNELRQMEIHRLQEQIKRIIAWIEDVKLHQDIMTTSQMEGLLESIK